jgi:hypothetical protein
MSHPVCINIWLHYHNSFLGIKVFYSVSTKTQLNPISAVLFSCFFQNKQNILVRLSVLNLFWKNKLKQTKTNLIKIYLNKQAVYLKLKNDNYIKKSFFGLSWSFVPLVISKHWNLLVDNEPKHWIKVFFQDSAKQFSVLVISKRN